MRIREANIYEMDGYKFTKPVTFGRACSEVFNAKAKGLPKGSIIVVHGDW